MERNITTIRPFSIPKAVFFRRIVGKRAYKGEGERRYWLDELLLFCAVRERERWCYLGESVFLCQNEKELHSGRERWTEKDGGFPVSFSLYSLEFLLFYDYIV